MDRRRNILVSLGNLLLLGTMTLPAAIRRRRTTTTTTRKLRLLVVYRSGEKQNKI